jgi:hypothetical protein
MNVKLLNRVFENNEEAIIEFAGADNCAVIDWRDGLLEIIAAVSHFLPRDYTQLQEFKATASDHTTQESLIDAVNRHIQPQYEIRQFKAIDGDTYSLFVAHTDFWKELEARNLREVEKYFLSTARLAAYWNKGYFARLFRKP